MTFCWVVYDFTGDFRDWCSEIRPTHTGFCCGRPIVFRRVVLDELERLEEAPEPLDSETESDEW